jgi:hypothetical protein
MALLLVLLACHAHPGHGAVPADAGAATASVERFPFPQLVDATCDEGGCTVLVGGALRRQTGEVLVTLPAGAWTGIDRGEGGFQLTASTPTGPCRAWLGDGATTPEACEPLAPPAWASVEDLPPIPEQLERFRIQWNAAIAAHGRLPFVPVLGTPDGGVIALARGGDGRGQLFRSGGMPKMIPVPTAPSPATWPAPFALHPSGTEAYLLPWPTTVLRAFDPFTLATRWSVGLDGAGQGLFVDPGGRWLLAATGPGEVEGFVDYPLLWTAPAEPCCEDALLRAAPRPPQERVVVVDLAAHTVAVRAPGAYRGWFAFEHVLWLVTDQEITRVPVQAPPG